MRRRQAGRYGAAQVRRTAVSDDRRRRATIQAAG